MSADAQINLCERKCIVITKFPTRKLKSVRLVQCTKKNFLRYRARAYFLCSLINIRALSFAL